MEPLSRVFDMLPYFKTTLPLVESLWHNKIRVVALLAKNGNFFCLTYKIAHELALCIISSKCFTFIVKRLKNMLFHSKTLLLKSIKTRNKLYKKHLQVPTVDNASLYKRYKNKLNDTLRLAKRRYYEKKLEDAKSNTHANWKILNEVLSRKKNKASIKYNI